MTTPQDPTAGQPQNPDGFPPPGGAPQQGQPGQQPEQYSAPGQPQQGQPGQPQQGQYPPPGPYQQPQDPSAAMPGMAGGPEEQPKKTNTSRIVIAAVVVLALVLGGVLYFVLRGSDPATAQAGDCIKVNKASTEDADVDKMSCDEPEAIYKVSAAGKDVQCDTAELEYTEETKDHDITTRLCLQPNVETGDCILPVDGNGNDFEKVDCAEHAGDENAVKIDLFDHSTNDETECPDGSIPIAAFETHVGLICASPVQ